MQLEQTSKMLKNTFENALNHYLKNNHSSEWPKLNMNVKIHLDIDYLI
jgi:hypothetical protein